ncbi:hypothetical protein [Streptomyces sp. bgisy091]|uniref:hypothetical protein n=1 Tax=Streptomyces sp. bgisy091 TaxID=3413778 RepID=UPI003D7035EB
MQGKQVHALGPIAAFAQYERALLAFVNEHTQPVDHARGPELARLAWVSAVGSLRMAPDAGMEEGLPVWLANAARRTVREQTSPARSAQVLTARKPFSQTPTTDVIAA